MSDIISLHNLSLDERLKLYNKAIELHRRGLGKRKIAQMLGISESTVSSWIYKGIKPDDTQKYLELGRKEYDIDLSPSFELSYIIGVVMGDGWISTVGRQHQIGLATKDKEFAEEFCRCLKKVIKGSDPKIGVKKDPRFGRTLYIVKINSRKLVNFIQSVNEAYLTKNYPEGFLRGLFDSDGYVTYHRKSYARRVALVNTSLQLLQMVKRILSSVFGIESKIYEKGVPDTPVIKGKKKVYLLAISKKEDIVKFYRFIGFTIKRRMKKLEEIVYG